VKKSDIKVAVCSRSFSRNPILREELFELYNNVTFNDDGQQLSNQSLIDFLKGHKKAITALEKVDDNILSQLPELEVISKYGVGLDMIDMDSMCNYGVKLGWTSGVNRRSVSELVISYSITLLRHVLNANREVLSGSWRQHIGNTLSGRTIGIIGCGNIGKDLVPLLQAFGCRVIINDIIEYTDFYKKYNLEHVSIEYLLAQSDIVTLHVPLNDSTKGILNKEKLEMMKSNAILINIARGSLVDELHLKKMLISGRIAAAAFDVFEQEPPQDQELLKLNNFLVTPHIGGSSSEAILAMGRAAIAGLDKNDIPNQKYF
jgi:phosphoglycerate dehydrogenase-like enzyme